MSFSIVDSTSSATVVLGGDSFTLCVFLGTTVLPGLLPYERPRKFYKVVPWVLLLRLLVAIGHVPIGAHLQRLYLLVFPARKGSGSEPLCRSPRFPTESFLPAFPAEIRIAF